MGFQGALSLISQFSGTFSFARVVIVAGVADTGSGALGFEDCPRLSRPGSAGPIPGLNGVRNGAGVFLGSEVWAFVLSGVLKDPEATENALMGGAERGWGCCVAAETKPDEGIGLLGFSGEPTLLGGLNCLGRYWALGDGIASVCPAEGREKPAGEGVAGVFESRILDTVWNVVRRGDSKLSEADLNPSIVASLNGDGPAIGATLSSATSPGSAFSSCCHDSILAFARAKASLEGIMIPLAEAFLNPVMAEAVENTGATNAGVTSTAAGLNHAS